jgi:hypothetical protein
LRHREIGDDADRCLPVFLYLQRLRRDAAAEAGRLLRVLFLRLGSVPADPGRALGRCGRRFLLSHIAIMVNEIVQSSRDWLSSPRTNALAWWIPKAAVVVALFIPRPARTGIWIIALVWMGTACILNSRRCGRTHCRYTGPYYLAMIAPVLALASGVISVGFYGWLALAVLILGGSMTIWWATERARGKFSRHDESF